LLSILLIVICHLRSITKYTSIYAHLLPPLCLLPPPTLPPRQTAEQTRSDKSWTRPADVALKARFAQVVPVNVTQLPLHVFRTIGAPSSTMGLSNLGRRIRNWFPSKSRQSPFGVGPNHGLANSMSVADFPYQFGGRAIESGDMLDMSVEDLPLALTLVPSHPQHTDQALIEPPDGTNPHHHLLLQCTS
jgi:hypothetical protein